MSDAKRYSHPASGKLPVHPRGVYVLASDYDAALSREAALTAVKIGIDDREAGISQEAYQIFLERDGVRLRQIEDERSSFETLNLEVVVLREKLSELSAIGVLINTQDNRCTDQPIFAVMEKRGMVTLDTHDHDRIEWYDPANVSTADDSKARRLEALHNSGRDTPGWERYAVKDVDVFVTACFTEQGCKDFLACDGHNHCQPFIYAFGSHRNGEYQAVRNRLKAMAAPARPTESGASE